LEIKKYLSAYRRVLFAAVSAVCTCWLVLAAVNVILERQSLFEPFSVGVVDYGDSPEIRMVFDFFSENAIQLEYMDKATAEDRLRRGEIPAYVELPERFAEDIIYGANTPFRLYGNNDMPLQWALSRLLASSGVAFLSSSQAGIYATIDLAREQGMEWDFINRYILFPINIAFINHMLRYDDFFVIETLPLTETGMSPVTHYVFCFTAFLLMLLTIAFVKSLTAYTRVVYDRYRLAGWSVWRVQSIRFAGLFAMNLLLTVPLYGLAVYVTGIPFWLGALALAFCVSGFGLMAAVLCKTDTACGIVIFISAAVMLFLAGGILPMPFLPQEIHGLRFATIPYWASVAGNGGLNGVGVLMGMGAAFLGLGCITEGITEGKKA
jgi:hypothetical protein